MRPLLHALAAAVAATGCGPAPSLPEPCAPPPRLLSATGLFGPGGVSEHELEAAPGVRTFTPWYPLWTDGATKRRWIRLPAGARIDARNPGAWDFPVGTMAWKELRFGRRVETRTMERLVGGSWRYATYVWAADGRDAELAPPEGVRSACTTPYGTAHDVPSESDCRVCHEGHPSRILGFGALQLAAESDGGGPHAEPRRAGDLDLEGLLADGRLIGVADDLRAVGRRHGARAPRERAILGYLHGNCSGCHNGAGGLDSLGLRADLDDGAVAGLRASAVGVASRFVRAGDAIRLRIAPGAPAESVLFARMASRHPALQMPPLGTRAVDVDALALLRDWIGSDLAAEASVAFELDE